MTRGRAGARPGVTLMELVVALVVTGMVAALGAATFNTVIDNRAIAREGTYSVTSAAATRALLVAWMSSGRITAQAERAQTATSLNLADDDDALLVVATTSTPVSSGQTVVHLFIDRDDETPEKGLVAELQSLDVTSRDLQTTVTRLVQLDSTVNGMLVEYLDEQSRRWIPRREAATRAPVAVRVTLSASGSDTLPSLLRLPIVQAMPRGGRGSTPSGGTRTPLATGRGGGPA